MSKSLSCTRNVIAPSATDTLDKLVAIHPKLFRGKRPRTISTIPQGWIGLINGLCGDIEEILAVESIELEVFQIKEKFGALRFYIGNDNSECEKIVELVRIAQTASSRLCMDCGAEASTTQPCLSRRRCVDCEVSQT